MSRAVLAVSPPDSAPRVPLSLGRLFLPVAQDDGQDACCMFRSGYPMRARLVESSAWQFPRICMFRAACDDIIFKQRSEVGCGQLMRALAILWAGRYNAHTTWSPNFLYKQDRGNAMIQRGCETNRKHQSHTLALRLSVLQRVCGIIQSYKRIRLS